MAPAIPPDSQQASKGGNAVSTATGDAPRSVATHNNNAAALRAARRSRNAGNSCSITATFAMPNRMMMMNHPRYRNHPFRREMEEHDSEEEDDDEDDDELENLHLCLHCRDEKTTDIQVRCDECTAYICNNCHWCHEYQANHEIRVCDRCDGFYCRNCDEMDQCDDCHQVFCTSCSTLLSCKFCGGGLCEDCATACGRCGIVLCSRDSKFAVECDTCRLPYCLVCLASGSKDACVRCGSRPSKRMEQLVHLRLKSIYKAFKQNTSHHQSHLHHGPSSFKASFSLKSSKASKASGGNSLLKDDYDYDDPYDLDMMFHSGNMLAGATATSKSKHTSAIRGKASVNGRPSQQSRSDSSLDNANRFKEEKEKADAAAAALLAELDEEEEVKGKSSKKKKKKNKCKQQTPQRQVSADQLKLESKASDGLRSEADSADDGLSDDLDDDVSSTEYISALAMLKGDNDDHRLDKKLPAKANQISLDRIEPLLEYPKNVSKEHNADPLENELLNLVAKEDIIGLENLLESIKGIPGRAGLRKNAKKALKRLKLEKAPPLMINMEEATLEEVQNDALQSTTPPDAFLNSNKYLHIVSLTHNKPASQCATPGSQHGAANVVRSRPCNSGGPLKSECVMHVRPLIVGWMIGKGGQRIRDLMEESGARIWIDQDSMGSQDPRLLYVSGARKNVDVAVGLLSDLVLKYQPLSSSHGRQLALSNPPSEKASVLTNSKDIPDPVDITTGPLKSKVGTSISNQSAVGALGDIRAKQSIICDPRFVPLLIGKRGWTIKNIQDTTGAKVDIDQTVTPRRITVSGIESNVEKAMRMVRDVLSYPHSQLHGCAVDDSNVDDFEQDVPDSALMSREHRNEEDAVVDIRQLEGNPFPVMSVDNGSDLPLNAPNTAKISGHSPPSSLIMTGDAKSTISASSSLSSTPELILPTSSSAKIPQLDIGPGTFSPQQNRSMFTTFAGDMLQGSCNPLVPGSSASFHLQSANHVYDVRDQNVPPMPPLNPVHAGINITGPLYHVSPNQGSRPTFLHEQQGLFLSHSSQTPVSMQGRITMSHPQSVYGTVNGPVDPQSNIHHSFLPNANSVSGVGNARFWNGIGTSPEFVQGGISAIPPPPLPSDNFHLDAAVEFLEHVQQQHSKPLTTMGDSNGFMGLTAPSATLQNQSLRSDQDSLLNFSRRQDDAQMVDSLFGPPTNSAGTGAMLTGLRGLSLNPNESTGIWGSGDPLIDPTSLRPLGSEDPLMFEGLPSPKPTSERKSESRFLWGESGPI